MDAGWTWLLIQAVSTPHCSCPELQRWTNQLPEHSEFVSVIKLNVIRLYTHCGGLLTEEDWQEMFRKLNCVPLAGPVPLRPRSVCFVACVLCAWLKLLTHKVSGQEGCLTSPETLAQEVEWPQQGWRVSGKLQLIKRPIRGEVLCEREVQGEGRQFTEHMKYCMPANMSLCVVLWW